MKKLSISACLLAALALAAYFGQAALKERIQAQVEQTLEANKSAISLSYRELRPELLSRRLVFHGVDFALPGQLALLMGRAESLEIRRGPAPDSFELRFSGLALTLPDPADFGLESLGYAPADLVAEGGLTVRREAASQGVSVEDCRLSLPRLGRLRLFLRLGGVDEAALSQGFWLSSAFFTLRELRLEYEDAGLAGRIMDRSAAAAGLSPADYREGLARAVPDWLAATFGSPASDRESAVLERLAPALSTFVREPRGLVLRLTPEAPMTLAEGLSFPPIESAALLKAELTTF